MRVYVRVPAAACRYRARTRLVAHPLNPTPAALPPGCLHGDECVVRRRTGRCNFGSRKYHLCLVSGESESVRGGRCAC